MRPAYLFLASAALVSCVLLAQGAWRGPKPPAPPKQPRGVRLRWQQHTAGKPPAEDALYREVQAHQARLAALPLATSGPSNWTLLGPGNIGGRIRSIVVNPAVPTTMYVGSVSGGVWKSTNSGSSWTALPDLPAVLCVDCMVLDPNAPDTLYAGTGEECFFNSVEGSSNSAVGVGAGVFKSTDGGQTWNHLTATSGAAWNAVARMAIDPNNSSILVAATISGLWRTTDGGATWSQRTTVKALDVEIDPNNSSRWIAGRADGTAQYSVDGGVTWANATPFTGATRVELEYARTTPGMVYAAASIGGANLTVWRSTNGGQSYGQISGNVVSVLANYSNAIWVDPTNSNNVVVGGLDLYRSTNGGVSFTKISAWASYPQSAHADHHVIVEHPGFNGSTNNTVYFGCDGGIQRATNIYTVSNTSGWTNLNNNLAITQFYGCCMNQNGVALGGAQDNGTVRGTSTSGLNGWTEPLGGDGSFCASDPNDPNYFYLQYYYINLYRSTNAGASSGNSIKGAINDATPNFMSYILLDPNDNNRLYACGANLWRTGNARTGNPPTWTSVKAPLVCPSIVPDPPRQDHYNDNPPCNISTVAVARGNANVVWVGHNNGAVFYTTNGLAAAPTWIQVDANGVGLPNRWVSRICIDPTDTNKVTVSFMGFTPDNVWRTTDSGASWSVRVGTGANTLPAVPVSCIVQHRMLGARYYAATDLGLYYTEDDGITWLPAVGGPSIVSMDELVWKNNRTLVVATHGRSMWTCDVDPAAVTPVGTGCGVATTPTLTVGAPAIGANQSYTLAAASPSAPVLLLLAGGGPSPLPIGPCVLQPSVAGLSVFSFGTTNATGGFQTNLAIPPDPALVGAVLTVQELIVVIGGPLLQIGELSNGAQMTLGF